jgi:hypothetical protein
MAHHSRSARITFAALVILAGALVAAVAALRGRD